MCWSRHERAEWLRAQQEREDERLRSLASEPEAKEPEVPEVELEEHEGELVRA